jgi:hypothetical protein
MRNAFLLAIVLVLLAAATLGGYATGHASAVGEEVNGLKKQVDDLSGKLEQQTSILNRAVGKYIPIQVPADTEKGFERIEARLSAADQWPKTADEADRLQADVNQLVIGLPPWAEEQLLPRLNLVRWGVRCLWLGCHTVTDDAAAGLAVEFQSLSTAAPAGASEALKEFTERQRAILQRRANEHAVRTARERAERARDGKDDLLDAIQGLDDLPHEALNEPLSKLRAELRARLLDGDTERKTKLLRASLSAAPELPTDALRQAGVLKVTDAAASLLLDLKTEDPPRPQAIKSIQALISDCDSKTKELLANERAVHEQKLRDYQKWALKQILDFSGDNGWHYDATLPWINGHLRSFKDADQPRENWELFANFPTTKDLLTEKLGIDTSEFKGATLTAEQQRAIYQAAYARVGWKANIDQEIAYRTTRDGMVIFLLPINVSLLEPPVADLYQKAFRKGWEKLEGRPDQLHVAKQAAEVKKKGLD